ncbi:threonine--tRNA ligase [Candidatus Kaiserbacteria bacterium]|nr:MAG: threonine--tRNA ligase [Candidatus Kaiserbacteria bacterium]
MEPLLEKKRHTLAHLLATAVRKEFPHAKPTIGPAIETGFYYDFDFNGGPTPKDEDLKNIERHMKKMLATWKVFSHTVVTPDIARDTFKNNQYKIELINDLEKNGETITLYTVGEGASEFTDLCRGGHSESPAKDIDVDSFTLTSVAGAYWRGDEKNAMLTRLYGLAFDTKDDLVKYLAGVVEAKKRDHRKLGKELDLFTFSELVGSGLPLYTPKGTILRDELGKFSESLQSRAGFEKVWIPHITKIDLYKKSGHWDKFGHELFLVKSQESSDEFALKPMNCPHHTQIYASRPRSYRDLPVRYMETTTCYRDEKTGELGGLTRVRSLTQDDAHVFCRPDQIEQEFESIMQMIKSLYRALGMEFKARLSFHDPEQKEKYLGDSELWKSAEEKIELVAKKLGLDYHVAIGEAAFYGPKIDIMVIDALGREWQCATQQLDFVQPGRFDLEYTDKDGTKKTPVMIHKALLGTIDRFLGVYIEHTAGNFPLWLAPEQIRIIPVADAHHEYAQHVYEELKAVGIRVTLVDASESLGKRIRAAKTDKLPYFAVVGDAEITNKNVTLESRGGGTSQMKLDKLGNHLLAEIEAKVL